MAVFGAGAEAPVLEIAAVAVVRGVMREQLAGFGDNIDVVAASAFERAVERAVCHIHAAVAVIVFFGAPTVLNGTADENVTEGERDPPVVAELKRVHADVEGLGSAPGKPSVDDSAPGAVVVFAPAQFAETFQQRVVVAPDGSGRVMRRAGDIGIGVRDEGVVAGIERVVDGRGFRRQIPGVLIVF